MTYEIKTINELEKLINDRKYIDKLNINIVHDVNHLLCNLTDLTDLCFFGDSN